MDWRRARGARQLVAVGLALGLWALADRSEAQDHRPTLTGRVVDPSGAAVPGVAISATHLETNTTAEVVSNAGGHYVVPFLSVGTYRITARAAGFKAFVREGIVLRTGERTSVDIELALGARSESVTVIAEAPAAQTSASIFSQSLGQRSVAELPLNGRQVYMLLQLTPGVLNNQTMFRDKGIPGTRAWDLSGNYSIHGARPDNNEFLIDGAPHAATAGWQYAPMVDAVEELKVQTSTVDASYGRTSGGVVSLTLRSGSNELHGSAFLFHRSDGLDANTTQNNRQGLGKSGHRFNNLGTLLSGPLWRDRTFFLGYVEGFRDRVPFPRTVTVPTELQRLGDFSQTFDQAGRLIVIYDPLTTRPDPSRPGHLIRDPFPGNRIPRERLSPVALRILEYLPRPNRPGEPFTQAGNLAVSPLGRLDYDSYLLRLDHRFGPSLRATLTSTANRGEEFRSDNGLAPPVLRGDWPRRRVHSLHSLEQVWTISPRMVLSTRGSLDRFASANSGDYARLPEDLGIATPFQVVPQFPQINLQGYENFFPSVARRETINRIWSASSILTVGMGSHALKTGAELRSYTIRRDSLGAGNGQFDFTREFTRREPAVQDTSGNAFASFLLGYPASGGVELTSPSYRRYPYAALFVQDDWALSRRVSLTLGLRWDFQAPVTERLDRLTVGFDTQSASPLALPDLPLTGGLVFGSADQRSPYRPEYGDFQPRIGISYRPAPSVALRVNYGRSYLPLTGSGQEGFQQNGFSRTTSLVSSLGNGMPFDTLERPFPSGLQPPPGALLGMATDIGSAITFTNPDFRIPYADQWMAGLTVDLSRRLTLDAAYVGTRTALLSTLSGRAINEVPFPERARAIERLGGDPGYLSALVPNPFAGRVPGSVLDAPLIRRGQLLRPFPQFLGLSMDKDNAGGARYDALEMSIKTHGGSGFWAAASYTYMRSREALGYLNPGYDAAPAWGLAANDRPHRFTLAFLWDLPFGSGKLLGGWQLNAIGEIQSGTPTAMPGGAVLRIPTPRLPAGQRTLEGWFDNSLITTPHPDGAYAWELIPRNELRTGDPRMPGVRNPTAPQWALSLFKNTRLHGRAVLQLRLEAFNVFNTPTYGPPELDITSPRFGRVTADQINFPRHVQVGARVAF